MAKKFRGQRVQSVQQPMPATIRSDNWSLDTILIVAGHGC